MGQKQLPEKAEEGTALGRIPEKTGGFLGQIEAEFTHAGYGVGSVNKWGINASGSGEYINASAGLGIGSLELEYYKNPLFFVAPRFGISVEYNGIGAYLTESMPIAPKTGKTLRSSPIYSNLGLTWEPVSAEKGNGMSFRLGGEGAMEVEYKDSKKVHMLLQAKLGIAAEYEGVTVYAIENLMFIPHKPYSMIFSPHHHKAQAGMEIDARVMGVGGEFFHTNLEKGAKLSFSFNANYVFPEIYFWYSREGRILGGGRKGGVGGSISFGSGALGAKGRVERGFGAELAWEGVPERWEARGDSSSAEDKLEDAIQESGDISGLASKYKGEDAESIIHAASLLGAYGYENSERMGQRELYELAAEGSFRAIRSHITMGTQGGAGICKNISPLQTRFLNEAGFDAFTFGFRGKKVAHVFTIAKDRKTGDTYLLNKGEVLVNKGGKAWPLIRQYSKERGIIPQGVYIYGKDDRIIGYYESDEAKLNRAMAGGEGRLKKELLHSRPRKRK